MKIMAQIFFAAALLCSMTACLFKEPVFQTGFLKLDPKLAGIWVSEGKDNDPRNMEFAVSLPLDEERCILHSPALDKGGNYYEARMLKIKDRILLQLRWLGSFGEGVKHDTETYTVLWLDGDLGGPSVKVRALDGDRLKGQSPAQVKATLEGPGEDWSKIFGAPVDYRRLKDH